MQDVAREMNLSETVILFQEGNGFHLRLVHPDHRDGFPRAARGSSQAPSELIRGLGVTSRYVDRNRFDYLVEVESEKVGRGLDPDFRLLATLPARRVMVTSLARSIPAYNFICRFFAPQYGIDEDPVTDSAFCSLGSFWRQRLQKDEFLVYQASARGDVVRVRVGDDERVHLGGQAVTVLRGELAQADSELLPFL